VAPQCTQPENPYDEGTGHYAGYEWAEKNSRAFGFTEESPDPSRICTSHMVGETITSLQLIDNTDQLHRRLHSRREKARDARTLVSHI
jgi:hypothetical protein